MNKPLHHPVRNLIREKMSKYDTVYQGSIIESIEMIKKGEFREASILLQDIASVADERKMLGKDYMPV